MKSVFRIFCLAVFCLLSSCKMVPQELLLPTEVLVAREQAKATGAKRGWDMPLMSLGGKGKYSRQTQNEIISFEWDDEASFREGMMAVVTGIYAYGQGIAKTAEEQTAQVTAKEGTKQANAKTAADLAAQKEANRHAEALLEFPAAPVPAP